MRRGRRDPAATAGSSASPLRVAGALCRSEPRAAAQEERSQLEMNPHTTITLDHARVCISHSDGITWVLTTDLGLGDESLAAHLDAAAQVRLHALAALVERLGQVAGLPQGFWFVARGGRRRLLEACGHRRGPYVEAVAAAAGLMVPLVTKTHNGEPFRSARTVFGPLPGLAAELQPCLQMLPGHRLPAVTGGRRSKDRAAGHGIAGCGRCAERVPGVRRLLPGRGAPHGRRRPAQVSRHREGVVEASASDLRLLCAAACRPISTRRPRGGCSL